MKNKNKKHIRLVNYICDFFYCAYPYVIILKRIFHIDILTNASNIHIWATLVGTSKVYGIG